MHPNKTGPSGMRGEPGFGAPYDIHPAPFHSSPTRLGLGMFGKVVVEIESAIKARRQTPAIQDYRPDEGRGLVAPHFEKLSPGDVRRRKRHGEIGDAMIARQQAG